MNDFVKDFVETYPVIEYKICRVKTSWTNAQGKQCACFNVTNPFNGYEMQFCVAYDTLTKFNNSIDDIKVGNIARFTLDCYKYKPSIRFVGVRHEQE